VSIATRDPAHGRSNDKASSNGIGTRWRPTAPRFGARAAPPTGSAPRPAIRRNPRLPLATLGVALVLGGALVFALVTMHTASGEEVLTVTHPLPAGSVINASDLGTVRLSGATSLAPIPATDEGAVIGRSVAVPVVGGSLLAESDLGSSSALTSGTEEVALALHAGQYPPDLTAGAKVDVVPVPSSSGLASSSGITPPTSAIAATVSAVATAPSGSTANVIISLVVPAKSADGVLALTAIGAASLAELPNRAGS
jgi:hypothetical protein